MEVPGIGPLTRDEATGWYYSQPVTVDALDITGRIVVTDDYVVDDDKAALHDAVTGFLNLDDTALRDASADLFAYYSDTVRQARDLGWDTELPKIQEAASVWDFVSFGNEFHVERDDLGDRQVYVSVECECDWEPEHGLQLVFRGGRTITKLGPFDGHLTNTNAFNRDDLADVIYVSPFAP